MGLITLDGSEISLFDSYKCLPLIVRRHYEVLGRNRPPTIVASCPWTVTDYDCRVFRRGVILSGGGGVLLVHRGHVSSILLCLRDFDHRDADRPSGAL